MAPGPWTRPRAVHTAAPPADAAPPCPARPAARQVLNEDISPALDKLRREKVQYMEWQNATNSLEKLRRFCVAYRYVEAERCGGAWGCSGLHGV